MIEAIVWMMKYKINLSLIMKILVENSIINEMVVISISNQKMINDLVEMRKRGLMIISTENKLEEDHDIYKKISLSMGYESNSFFSLSYFASKNCKFLIGNSRNN